MTVVQKWVYYCKFVNRVRNLEFLWQDSNRVGTEPIFKKFHSNRFSGESHKQSKYFALILNSYTITLGHLRDVETNDGSPLPHPHL